MSDTNLTIDINCNNDGVFTLRVCAQGPHSLPAAHRRAAAVYRLAAELEQLASVEELAFTVDAKAAQDGVILASITQPTGAQSLDVMMEICIDAASRSGLAPAVDF